MEKDSVSAFLAGVAISIVCSICNSLGMGLQRQSHHRDPQGLFFRERTWLVGLSCMAVASLLSLGNYSLLGQARASAMTSLTIVTNAIMARFMLNEVLTWADGGATLLIGSGIIVAVVYGSNGGGAPRTSLDDVVALLRRDVVVIAASVLVALLVICEMCVRISEKRGGRVLGKIECFTRALMAGLFSGCTGFLAKSVVVSIEAMVAAKSPADLKRFEIWLIGLSLPISIVFQLRALNGGLRRFPAMEVVPIYQACVVVSGVAFGWIVFEENEYLDPIDETMFAVGVAISVLGIALLSFKTGPNNTTQKKVISPTSKTVSLDPDSGFHSNPSSSSSHIISEKTSLIASVSQNTQPHSTLQPMYSSSSSSSSGVDHGPPTLSSQDPPLPPFHRPHSPFKDFFRASFDGTSPSRRNSRRDSFLTANSPDGGSLSSRERSSTLVPSVGFSMAIEAFAPAQIAMLLTGSSSQHIGGYRAQSVSDATSLELSSMHEESKIEREEKFDKIDKRAFSNSR
jgi:hypothetical protein